MPNYWVVGAAWGGVEHQDQKFVEQGIWMLGWAEGEQPAQYKKASEMQPGDRIAIKRMKGQGQTGIRILHLGIIKGVILETNKVICTVDWIAVDLDRNIKESRGCFKSIHGPFEHDSWVEQVFCL
jgi:Fe2+ transport system protein FeoA